jgi:hypothetical protein
MRFFRFLHFKMILQLLQIGIKILEGLNGAQHHLIPLLFLLNNG